MSNNSIDIQAVNSSVLSVPESTTKAPPSLTEAYYSLFLVVGIIITLAFIVKKMGANTRFKKSKHLNIVDSISVGTKEKVVIVKQNNILYTLGVTSSAVTLLDKNEINDIEKTEDNQDMIEEMSVKNNSISLSFKKTLDQLLHKKSNK